MKELLKYLKFNFFIAISITLVLVVINSVYTDFSFKNSVFTDDFYIVFMLILIGTFIKRKWALITYFTFLLMLFLTEILHWIYYGNPILPSEIFKFFTDFTEVTQGIGGSTLSMFLIPLVVIVISLFVLGFVIHKINHLMYKISYVWLLPIVALFVLSYNASIEQVVNKAPKPNQNLARSGLECIGGFCGKYLPAKLFDENFGGYVGPIPQKINDSNADIILIFGESLTYKHMSLFGYSNPTTPKLDSLFSLNQINKKRCISAATCTDVSLLSFFNLLDSARQFNQIQQGNHFLFKLAKQNNYETSFITSQSLTGSSSYIGQMDKTYIDYFSAASIHNPLLSSSDFSLDSVLLPQLIKALQGNSKKFVTMQMYGSHEEYKERYPSTYNVFKEDKYRFPQTAHYDNSVRYTDYILSQLLSYIAHNVRKPTYVFFVSDHGELVGEEDNFGHNMFRKPVLSVPLIYTTYNNPTDTICDWINSSNPMFTHFKLSVVVARLLGYSYKFPTINKTVVNGMDIGGLDGVADVTYNDSTILEVKVTQ